MQQQQKYKDLLILTGSHQSNTDQASWILLPQPSRMLGLQMCHQAQMKGKIFRPTTKSASKIFNQLWLEKAYFVFRKRYQETLLRFDTSPFRFQNQLNKSQRFMQASFSIHGNWSGCRISFKCQVPVTYIKMASYCFSTFS